jgi:pimeloyl-ACP methyl ester carboxylesterase
MGGAVAMLLAQRHPDLVSAIVFAGTALQWSDSTRDRLVWRGMSLFEVALRNGTGDGLVARIAREAIEESPHLAAYEAWASGEFHRGYPADLAGAGRALAAYDGRPMAAIFDLPAAVVVTTQDRMVAPARQRALAEAVGGRIFEVEADHSAFFTRSAEFAAAVRAGVDHVVGVEG